MLFDNESGRYRSRTEFRCHVLLLLPVPQGHPQRPELNSSCTYLTVYSAAVLSSNSSPRAQINSQIFSSSWQQRSRKQRHCWQRCMPLLFRPLLLMMQHRCRCLPSSCGCNGIKLLKQPRLCCISHTHQKGSREQAGGSRDRFVHVRRLSSTTAVSNTTGGLSTNAVGSAKAW